MVASVGREFDKNGNLRPWWNDASVKRFQERTQCMADQYSQYTLGGENVSLHYIFPHLITLYTFCL